MSVSAMRFLNYRFCTYRGLVGAAGVPPLWDNCLCAVAFPVRVC